MSRTMIGQIPYWIFCMLVVGSCAQALTCYETNENGKMFETTNDEFAYCEFSPGHFDTNEYIQSSAFGVISEKGPTEVYEKIFETSNEVYQILAFCIYERYDFSKMSPRFASKEPEFMLRCFCNFDKCNHGKNFFGYLDNLKTV